MAKASCDEAQGDIDDLARRLFVRGSKHLFFLTLDAIAASDGADEEGRLASFCTELMACGSNILHGVTDITLLSPAQFGELAACMLRGGIELGLEPNAPDAGAGAGAGAGAARPPPVATADAFSVSVAGAGGTFRAHVRITHPRQGP